MMTGLLAFFCGFSFQGNKSKESTHSLRFIRFIDVIESDNLLLSLINHDNQYHISPYFSNRNEANVILLDCFPINMSP